MADTLELVRELEQRFDGLVAFCAARVMDDLVAVPFTPDDEVEGTSGWERTQAVIKREVTELCDKELVLLAVRFNTDYSTSEPVDQYAERLQRQAARLLRENEERDDDPWGCALPWLAHVLFVGHVMCAVHWEMAERKGWSAESWFGV